MYCMVIYTCMGGGLLWISCVFRPTEHAVHEANLKFPVCIRNQSPGCILILLSSSKFSSRELSKRFWLQEHKWPLNFSESALENLDKLGIEYKVETIKGEVDFTEYFRDESQKSNQKHLMDFTTHTKIEHYPPAVYQTCMDYLASIANGKPKQYIFPFSTDFIVIES